MHTPRPRNANDKGFTLIELLVVMIIIGILAAIAVPIYLNQQKTANDTTLISDVKNAATSAQDALLQYGDFQGINVAIDNGVRHTIHVNPDSGVKEVPAGRSEWNPSGKLPTIVHDDGTYMEIVHIFTPQPETKWEKHDDNEFCIFAAHGNGKKYDWKAGHPDGARSYTRNLFYDTRLGGVTEISTIAKAVQGKSDADAALVSSCHGYGLRYLAAGGTI